MMEANELRIGNVLKSVHTGENISVDWLVIKHIMDGNKQSPPYDMSSVYEPIPLTEEILLKCGFTEKTAFDGDGNEHDYFAHKHLDFILEYDFQPKEYGFKVLKYKLEHVHQLQNLYFALTGEELNIYR